MRKLIICAAVFFGLVAPSHAVTVNFSAPGIADDVADLIVDGVIYDVDFVGNISGADWATMLDFSDQASALAAATALAIVLEANGVTALALLDGGGTPRTVNFAQTFYANGATELMGARVANFSNTQPWSAGLSTFGNGAGSFPFALDFTQTGVVSNVPLPAALPLLASMLGGLGLFGWRARRKAHNTA